MTCARKSSTASRVIVPTLFGWLTGQARYVGCRCRRPAGPISVSVMADDDATIAIPRDLYERLEWLAGWRGRPVRDLVLDALGEVAASAPPAGEEDDYSDAERDEVAARLASLGYIDECPRPGPWLIRSRSPRWGMPGSGSRPPACAC